ncbi:MAG: hypothetical protein AAF611_16495 [Bacteroidota bacterium]
MKKIKTNTNVFIVLILVLILFFFVKTFFKYQEEKRFVLDVEKNSELMLLTSFFIDVIDSQKGFEDHDLEEKLNHFVKTKKLACLKYGYSLKIDKNKVTLYSYGIDRVDNKNKNLIYNKNLIQN